MGDNQSEAGAGPATAELGGPRPLSVLIVDDEPLVRAGMVRVLRLAGYDRVLSIEHEDSEMSKLEGLRKAAAFLRECIISEPAPAAWWT